MAAFVLLALFLGPIRSAYVARSQAKDAFFAQEDGFGNLDETFLSVTDNAKRLQSLGKKYDLEGAAQYKELIDTVKKSKMPAEKLYALETLQSETERVCEGLSQKGLTSAEENNVSRWRSRIDADIQRIEQIARVRKTAFNAAAEEYNTGVLDSPLVGWLLHLLGFEELEKLE